MDVPQKIKNRIAEIVTENKKNEERKQRAEEAEKMRLQKINDLRETKRTELEAADNFVMLWLQEFWKSKTAKEIFSLRTEVMLFVGHFWRGEPAPEKDITTCATLSLRSKAPRMVYRELHKGHASRTEELVVPFHVHSADKTWQHSELVSELHPDFLLQFAEAIKSGKVWDHVLRSLR